MLSLQNGLLKLLVAIQWTMCSQVTAHVFTECYTQWKVFLIWAKCHEGACMGSTAPCWTDTVITPDGLHVNVLE